MPEAAPTRPALNWTSSSRLLPVVVVAPVNVMRMSTVASFARPVTELKSTVCRLNAVAIDVTAVKAVKVAPPSVE